MKVQSLHSYSLAIRGSVLNPSVYFTAAILKVNAAYSHRNWGWRQFNNIFATVVAKGDMGHD